MFGSLCLGGRLLLAGGVCRCGRPIETSRKALSLYRYVVVMHIALAEMLRAIHANLVLHGVVGSKCSGCAIIVGDKAEWRG